MNKLSDYILADARKACQNIDFHELKGKKIIVTGASGLLGVHFLACLKLIAKEFSGDLNVFAVMQSRSPDFVNDFTESENVTVFSGDLTDFLFLKKLPKADYIIHAAGYGQPGRFLENQIKTITVNTAVLLNLFEKLLLNGKFLFLSTSEVYSGLIYPPHKESEIGITNTTHPRSCYIESKRCGEAICNAYRAKGIQAKSARLCLAYGPGTRNNDVRVINSFIQKALTQKSINLIDHGAAKRTYCYISDAIEILWNILLKGKEPIYNVGGFSKVSIAELAQQVGVLCNVPVVFPEKVDAIKGAPDDVFLDMQIVEQEFKKYDYVPFIEGLKNTINFQKLLYINNNL